MIAPNQVSTAHTLDVCESMLYSMEEVAVAVLTNANVMDEDDTPIMSKRL